MWDLLLQVTLFHLTCDLVVVESYASAHLVCTRSVGDTKCLLDTFPFSGRCLAVVVGCVSICTRGFEFEF